MIRVLLLLLAIGAALWLLRSNRRAALPPRPRKPPAPAPMIACAHCGVHLPQADTVGDAAGRAYCSEAHRAAGPR